MNGREFAGTGEVFRFTLKQYLKAKSTLVSMIVLLIGLVGEYIGRIYLSINRYPQFVVRRVMHGGEEAKHEDDARSLGA